MKINQAVFTLFLGSVFFLLPGALFAAGSVTINTNLPGPYSVATGGPVAIVANAYYLALALGGLLAFGSIVYAGIKWTASRGNASAISDAQDQITQAVIGLLILLGTYIILNTINPTLTLLQIPKLSEIKGEVVAPPPSGGAPAPGACPINPLTPIENFGPQTAAMEGGQNKIWNSSDPNASANLAALLTEYNKLKQVAGNNGFTVSENSIYRPLGYQKHFYEIKDRGTKLEALTGDAVTACVSLKSAVDAERSKHGICQTGYSACYVATPSGCSPHVMGKGVDLSVSKGGSNTDSVYSALDSLLQANNITLRWKTLSGDKYHFELKNPPAGCASN